MKKRILLTKGLITNLASNPCNKRVIKEIYSHEYQINKAIQRNSSDEVGVDREEYDLGYIGDKLGIGECPPKNIIPMSYYTSSAICAELETLIKLIYKDECKIFTCEKEDDYYYDKYLDTKDLHRLTKELSKKIEDYHVIEATDNLSQDNKSFNKCKYEVQTEEDIQKLKDLIDNKRADYIYQMKFRINNAIDMVGKLAPELIPFYSKNIVEFEACMPDFIKIIYVEEKKSYKVLDPNFNIISSSSNKPKLQLCDVKMSSMRPAFAIELAFYMLALNQFLIENLMTDKYEVLTTGIIYEENLKYLKLNNTEEMKENIINLDNIKLSIHKVFSEKLPSVIDIINSGNKDKYNLVDNFNINSCAGCDYLGDYYSGGVEINGERVSFSNLTEHIKENPSIEMKYKKYGILDGFKCFFNTEGNDFCYFNEIRNKTINTISTLSASEKKAFFDNDIISYEEINDSIYDLYENENMNLKAKRKQNQTTIGIKKEDKSNSLYSKKTANATKNKNNTLNIYIDSKSDTQDIGLTLAVGFEYVKGWNSGVPDIEPILTYENVDKGKSNMGILYNPYVLVIDDVKEEKCKFIQLLIQINKVMKLFEQKRDNAGDQRLYFSVYYWDEDVYKYFVKMFMETIPVIVSRNELDYEEELKNLFKREWDAGLMNQIKQVYHRFRGIFTLEKRDQIYIKNRFIYGLKRAVEDIYSFNTNYANDLYSVLPKLNYFDVELLKRNGKYLGKYIPSSDKFNGGTFSKYLEGHKDSMKQHILKDELIDIMKYRICSLALVRANIKDSQISIDPPMIPPASYTKDICNNFVMGNQLYLFSKLQTYSDKSGIESLHAKEANNKVILGNSIKLDCELLGTQRETLLSANNLPISDSYKVYKLSKDSIVCNYKNKDRTLLMYPADKFEFIYKRFVDELSYRDNCIYVSDSALLKKISSKIFLNDKFKDEDTEEVLNLYKNVMNGVKIERIERSHDPAYVIFEIDSLQLQIMNYLTDAYNFDFSENVIVESEFFDSWLYALRNSLREIDLNNHAIELLENLCPINISIENRAEEVTIIKKYLNESLDIDKLDAIANTALQRLSLLWGPPGTGKTFTIVRNIIYFILKNMERDLRIFLIGNYDATKEILSKLLEYLSEYNDVYNIKSKIAIKRVISSERMHEENVNSTAIPFMYMETDESLGTINLLNMQNKFEIISITPNQMFKFVRKGTLNRGNVRGLKNQKDYFDKQDNLIEQFAASGADFVIVDEASQMDVPHFIPSMLAIGENTKVMLSGDHNQLEPVLKIKLKDADENYFGSILQFFRNEYEKYRELIEKPLFYNRRSNEVIVNAIKYIMPDGYPDEFSAYKNEFGNDERKRRVEFVNTSDIFHDRILDGNSPITLIKYSDKSYGRINDYEISELSSLIRMIWDKRLMVSEKTYDDLIQFFCKAIGIVVTHTAQKILLQNKLIREFSKEIETAEEKEDIVNSIISCVDTVERYQGQEREIMIGSFVVTDKELINQEAEFLYDQNRLNVMLSRARSKFILYVSNNLLENVPVDFARFEDQGALLRLHEYCKNETIISHDLIVRNATF